MFDFGKSLMTMNTDEQKAMLANSTPAQRKSALEMGIGFKNQNQYQQERQQKRDACHDLDRLNFTVEKENEAHDFFGKGLADWQENVTGREPSKDAVNLKKQFVHPSPLLSISDRRNQPNRWSPWSLLSHRKRRDARCPSPSA